jgi:pyruvate dehydrogenase E2 component (dihydrolipoamide acetyltransferase)
MATDVIMPQMGESIAEGTITKWIKNVGDTVARDEPLFEISTDKVDAEIPSPAPGKLTEILVKSGETVPVNTVVGRIAAAGEQPAAETAAKPAETSAEAPAKPAVPPKPAAEAAKPPEPPKPAAPPAPSKPEGAAAPPAPAPAPTAPATAASPAVASLEERIRTRSSPLVRKIAQEHEVDITGVEGTGIAGRVTKNDILSFIENRKTSPKAPERAEPARAAGSARPAEAPARAEVLRGERDETVPMSVMRRKIAERMVQSRRTSAHVTTFFEVDFSGVARFRDQNKDSFFQMHGTKLTFMPFIFQAVTAALQKFPEVNASIDGDDVVYHKDINLGMAVALDWGLIVPVIKNAAEKSILGLARAANDLAERARTKRLKPEEVAGGTFTITNPGIYGSLIGTPIIVQPQVAIMGVGAIAKRPVVVTDKDGNDSIGIRTMGWLSLSFDHRLIDGAVADQFMAFVKKTIEEAKFSLA